MRDGEGGKKRLFLTAGRSKSVDDLLIMKIDSQSYLLS